MILARKISKMIHGFSSDVRYLERKYVKFPQELVEQHSSVRTNRYEHCINYRLKFVTKMCGIVAVGEVQSCINRLRHSRERALSSCESHSIFMILAASGFNFHRPVATALQIWLGNGFNVPARAATSYRHEKMRGADSLQKSKVGENNQN